MDRIWIGLIVFVYCLGFVLIKGVASENTDANIMPSNNGREPAGLVFDNPNKVVPLKEEQASVSTKVFAVSDMRRKGVQEVALIASDLGYFPKTVFISRDVPTRLYVTSASKNALCIMMDAFQVKKQIKSYSIEEITFMPNMPGKYRFYCPINGMEGSLIVKELVTNEQEAPK
ncbi:MAG: cupredoxin domain-containing protein [Bdellovibrio sp.]|nr:cupredoxin domain-containing protein [Bdellovibrio sp.]